MNRCTVNRIVIRLGSAQLTNRRDDDPRAQPMFVRDDDEDSD